MATKLKEKKDSSSKKEQQKVIDTALERFRLAEEAESEVRRLALDDIKFSIGEQWPDEIRRIRNADGRPCLTINRLPQNIHQLTNDQRQNRPSIKVSPVDDKADVETAKIYQGLIRHIEYSSDADTAYDQAFDSAVRGSFGFFRIVTDYCDPYSFEQDIFIKTIPNRFSVYLDPSSQKLDGSDAAWGFVFEDINKDEFKALYPKAELTGMHDWESLGSKMRDWVKSNSARVAEYFYKTFKETELVLLSTGDVFEKDKLEEALKKSPEKFLGVTIVGRRPTVLPAIKWCKMTATEVLEETDWPGQWIPIIPVYGDVIDVDGKKVIESLIRHAKDSQRMYNYQATNEAETIALAPRAPWIGYEGQFEGHEAQWRTANTRNHAFLQVKPTDIKGNVLPFPTRNVFEPPIQAITQARMMASEDLKSTMGIYDASLGNRSNENSGIAIQRRNLQAQTSNFHFIDNLSKSLRHAGRIIVDLIPHIYDTARAIRILGEDGSEDVVKINQEFQKENGEMAAHYMGVGKYDVTVSTGPSFETKRQEAVQAMLDFTKAMPQHAAVISDLLVKNMDWPGAQEIAERLKKTLPPGIADEKDKKPVPPEAQAQMQQMGQMIEALTKQLNEANDDIKTKALELESKERIEMAKLKANIEIELAKMGSKESQVLLGHEIAQIRERQALLNYDQPIDTEFEQSAGGSSAMAQGPNQPPTGGSSPGQPMGV